MRRRVLVLLVALVLPAEAAAEGYVSVTVCGASGCVAVEGSPSARSSLAHPDVESVPPPPVGAYYSLRFAGADPSRGYYVPQARLLVTIDRAGARTGVDGVATWTPLPAAASEALARAVRDLRPFAQPELTGAEIGFEPVADPRGYLRLFEVESTGATVPVRGDWRPIILSADRPNPWTSGTRLSYSPSGKLLRRGQEIVRLPDETAADLEARNSLADADAGGGGWWRGALVGAAAALVLLGVGVAARGARRAPRPRSPAAT
jgi:hypothetical protein